MGQQVQQRPFGARQGEVAVGDDGDLHGRPSEVPTLVVELLVGGPGRWRRLHGRRDELVWFAQSQRFARRLTELGVPNALVELPWATHAGEANLHGPSGQLITEAVLRAARGG